MEVLLLLFYETAKNVRIRLTDVFLRDSIQKIESLDRGAGFISTALQGQATAGQEREYRRSCYGA